MEKQKIFWVVLSVSVFVVVVLVVGVLLLRPRPIGVAEVSANAVSPLSDPGISIYEYTLEKPAIGPGDNTDTLRFVIGEEGAQPSEGEAPAVTTTRASEIPASSSAAPAAKAEPAPKKTVPGTPAPSKPPQKSIEYWIQIGSYKSQSRAEELATGLSTKGLVARVFSYTTAQSKFFRVRIGPYANKGEAEKFLTIVKKIQGLESSYISMVGGTKTAN